MANVRTAGNGTDDPFGLRNLGSAPYAMYLVAVESTTCRSGILNRTAALTHLRRLALDGPFQLDYVGRIALKLIDPQGHGANSDRFKGPELAQFREDHAEYSMLTDALVLFLIACVWWIRKKGSRATQPELPLVTTSDLDHLLRQLGFLQRERAAIVRLIIHRHRLR